MRKIITKKCEKLFNQIKIKPDKVFNDMYEVYS